MTDKDRIFLDKINTYADQVMPDIDPQKVRISEQIEKLRPILQELAMQEKDSVENIFIRYMDLATEASVEYDKKMNQDFDGVFSFEKKTKL